jgi:hypothetical protein
LVVGLFLCNFLVFSSVIPAAILSHVPSNTTSEWTTVSKGDSLEIRGFDYRAVAPQQIKVGSPPILLSTPSLPNALWTRTFGEEGVDRGSAVVECQSGGFALAGYTDSLGAGKEDFWLVRTDSDGEVLWSHTYGGAGSDLATSVIECSTGGFVLVGYTESFSAGRADIWLVRTDADGNYLWSQTFGGSQPDWGEAIIEVTGGGYAVIGVTESYGAGLWDMWLLRTDEDGNLLWNQTFGDSSYDGGCSLVEVSSGGFALTGWTRSYGAGNDDGWLIRTDHAGNELWSKTYGGPDYDDSYAVIEVSDGGFALTGYTSSSGNGRADVWLIRTDSHGDAIWTQSFGGSDSDAGYSLVECAEGGFAITGSTYSFGAGDGDFWLLQTDSNGHLLWDYAYGGPDNDGAQALIEVSDGGFLLVGSTYSFGAGQADAWMIRVRLEPVTGIIDLDPNTLNRKSKGKWVTCYIELPTEYIVEDIVVASLLLVGEIPAELHPFAIGDYDGDGVPDLMVKFSRQALIDYLDTQTGYISIALTGEFISGTSLEGIALIYVI